MNLAIDGEADVQRSHTGCLPEPLRTGWRGAVVYSWVRAGCLSGDPAGRGWRCEVDAARFAALAANAADDGACGTTARAAVSYPTRDAALRAADRAGLAVADHQYDGRLDPQAVRFAGGDETFDECEIVCPWCGAEHPDSHGLGGDYSTSGEEECERCGLAYEWDSDVTVTYGTRRKEG